MARYFGTALVIGLALIGCRAGSPEPALSGPEPAAAVVLEAEPSPEPQPDRPAVSAVVASTEVTEALPPEPAPVEAPAVPEPFADREHVQVQELFAELEQVAVRMESEPAVRADYEQLLATSGLVHDEALYRDYVRVKLAFEATRDGGWWHLRWDITNEKPNSDQIWKQWKRAEAGTDDAPQPTATAECDELSALFAFVARNLGVRHIGLFWPQWNHVVAVWTVQSSEGEPVRIVVPTSQIFLGPDESLGTDGFDPWTQKKIFEYRRKDVKPGHRIRADLARFFVVQARRHGGRSQIEQQKLRNARDRAMSAADA